MRKTRQLAMQLLFLWDTGGANDPATTGQLTHDVSDDEILRKRAVEMATGAWEQREVSDRWVERLAPLWPPHRQPVVDRNILRLAVWEMTNTPTDARIVIDEAVELAQEYSTAQSDAFINGVLDSILKEHTALIAHTSAPDPQPQS